MALHGYLKYLKLVKGADNSFSQGLLFNNHALAKIKLLETVKDTASKSILNQNLYHAHISIKCNKSRICSPLTFNKQFFSLKFFWGKFG